MFSKRVFVAVIAISIIVVDQITKWYVRQHFGLYESLPVIDSLFHITYALNTGAAFSLFADAHPMLRIPFFISMTIIAVGALLYFLREVGEDQRLMQFALAGILGGAIGNFIDRVAFGAVTDFLDVHYGAWTWPTFNVADSFISIGMVVLLLHSLLSKDETQQKALVA